MEAGRCPRTPEIIQGRGSNGSENGEERAVIRCIKEVDFEQLDGW